VTRVTGSVGWDFVQHSAVVARLDRATQNSRDISAQAQPPLEYWIARSSRAMTSEKMTTAEKTTICVLAARNARVLPTRTPSSIQRARGMPDAGRTHGPPATRKRRRQLPQVQPEQPAFPARWFSAYGALSPGCRAW